MCTEEGKHRLLFPLMHQSRVLCVVRIEREAREKAKRERADAAAAREVVSFAAPLVADAVSAAESAETKKIAARVVAPRVAACRAPPAPACTPPRAPSRLSLRWPLRLELLC